MKRFKEYSLSMMLLGGGCLILWMVLSNIRPIQDPDIWWHLASGRYMVEHRIIPKADVFSLTAQGSSWVDTYWLQEILLYLVYSKTGIYGLILSNAIIIAVIVFLIGYMNPAPGPSWSGRLLGIVWIFLACHPRGYGWGEKASLVSFGFLALLFYTLQSDKWPLESRLARAWPLLFILWANMHRGFILGLVILSCFSAERWITRRPGRLRLCLWWLSSVLATLLNPWGYNVYGMGWQDYRLSPTSVTGWAQTPFYHLELFWVTLAIFTYFAAWTFWNRRSPGLGFCLTSIVLGWFSIRYASLYPYFVAWAVPWLLVVFSNTSQRFEKARLEPLVFALIIVASLDVRPSFGVNEHIFPVKAVEFLKDKNIRVPFFHEYELGGYYLWALEGNPPVLIDGRYPAVQGYQSLFPELQRIIHGTPVDFHRFLKDHDIHCAVVKYPSTQFLPNPFTVYFPRSQWALVYWDDLVLIFVQRLPRFRKTIETGEFRYVQPDADPDYWRKTAWDRASPADRVHVREEITRNARLHPDSWRVRYWLYLMSKT